MDSVSHTEEHAVVRAICQQLSGSLCSEEHGVLWGFGQSVMPEGGSALSVCSVYVLSKHHSSSGSSSCYYYCFSSTIELVNF